MDDVLNTLCSHLFFGEPFGEMFASINPVSAKMVPNFEAISGWNNTKLRLEPPQRDKAGDSLNLSGIN